MNIAATEYTVNLTKEESVHLRWALDKIISNPVVEELDADEEDVVKGLYELLTLGTGV